jgi:hypothetical protein
VEMALQDRRSSKVGRAALGFTLEHLPRVHLESSGSQKHILQSVCIVLEAIEWVFWKEVMR